MYFLLIPFIAQGAAMFVDEFYFHRARGLPAWERIGHPLDTISTLVCYAWALATVPTQTNIIIFVSLCIFSCLFVTKDEFVHAKLCGAGESWLHAVLFILHPIAFFCLGYIWVSPIEPLHHLLNTAMTYQIYLMLGFLIYQIMYWGLLFKNKQA